MSFARRFTSETIAATDFGKPTKARRRLKRETGAKSEIKRANYGFNEVAQPKK